MDTSDGKPSPRGTPAAGLLPHLPSLCALLLHWVRWPAWPWASRALRLGAGWSPVIDCLLECPKSLNSGAIERLRRESQLNSVSGESSVN